MVVSITAGGAYNDKEYIIQCRPEERKVSMPDYTFLGFVNYQNTLTYCSVSNASYILIFGELKKDITEDGTYVPRRITKSQDGYMVQKFIYINKKRPSVKKNACCYATYYTLMMCYILNVLQAQLSITLLSPVIHNRYLPIYCVCVCVSLHFASLHTTIYFLKAHACIRSLTQ